MTTALTQEETAVLQILLEKLSVVHASSDTITSQIHAIRQVLRDNAQGMCTVQFMFVRRVDDSYATNFVGTIKLVRHVAGIGLGDAKDLVEAAEVHPVRIRLASATMAREALEHLKALGCRGELVDE